MLSTVALRYSKTFFELAQEQSSETLDALINDFSLIKKTLSIQEMQDFIAMPLLKANEQQIIIDKLFKDKINSFSLKCLHFLINKSRLSILEDCCNKIEDLYNVYKNRQKIVVTSAEAMNQEQLSSIKKVHEEELQKEIVLVEIVDQQLIAGFKIQINDVIKDFSLLSQIEKLKKSIV